MNPLEPHAAEISEHAGAHRDVDACRALLRDVIHKAAKDLEYLARFEGRTELQKHELERVRRIEENPPADFIEGAWFEEICEYLGMDPGKVRRGLGEYMESAA